MSRFVAALVLALGLLVPSHSPALFHLASIDEVMSGVGADPSVQYVEIRMLNALQNFVIGARVVAFDCTGSTATVLATATTNVANAGAGVRWIVGTASFTTSSGITPDFPISSAALDPTCGMVCFGGGPGGPTRISPENPPTWSITDLGNYVNCVAYGGYSGATAPGVTQTATAGAGDGTYSLTRSSGTVFGLACPTPTNNAGSAGSFGPCSPPTTTTTSSTTSTTATTLPEGLTGKKLLLKDNADPTKKGAVILSKDAGTDIGGGNGSADDPTANGGSVRVRTTDGCGGPCDATYSMPSSGWTTIGKPGQNKGYKYKDKLLANGPAKVAIIKPGKLFKVVAKGNQLTHELAADPQPVSVSFTIGGRTFCLTFGGTQKFDLDKKFQAKDALVPGTCPP